MSEITNWPTINGKPAALVSNGTSEKLGSGFPGIPDFSSIDIGPATVTKFVEDTPEEIARGLQECLLAANANLETERNAILASLK